MDDFTTLDLIKKKAIRGVVVLTGRQFFLQILGVIGTFLVTVFLNLNDFGIFIIVSAAVSFFTYFSDIGLAAALIQKKDSPSEEELKTTFTVQTALVLILVTIIFLATPLYRQWYHLDQQAIYLFWALAVSLLMASLMGIPSALMERKLDFNKIAILQIVGQVLYQAVVVVLAWQGFGVNSFTAAVLIRGLATLVLAYIFQPWRPGIAFSKEALKGLLRFGLPYQVNTFLAVAKDDGMLAFLGVILGSANMALLGWALKWAQYPLRLFMDNVIRVTFPAFSRMQEHKEELSKAVSKSIFFVCALVFPSLVSLIFIAPILVDIIPKYDKYQPALLALALMSINYAWAAVTTPLTNVLSAVGKIKTTFRLMIMWTVLTWLVIPILAYLYGVNGAAVGYAVVGSSSIIAILVAVKSVKVAFLESVGKPLLASTLMAGVFILGRQFLPVSLIGAGVLLLIGGIVYLTAGFILGGPTLIEDIKKIVANYQLKKANG